MSFNNVFLKQFDCLAGQCGLLGSLQDNERLWTFGHRISKHSAPDRFFKGKQSLLIIHKIVTLAIKLFQTIVRTLTRQSTNQNILTANRRVDLLLQTLRQDMPDPISHSFLQKLGGVLKEMQKAHDSGLVHFRKTCELGKGSLRPQKEAVRMDQGERVEELRKKIGDEILPLLSQRIQEIEEKLYIIDKQKALELMDQLKQEQGPKQDDLKNILFSSKTAQEVLNQFYCKPLVDRTLIRYQLQNAKTLSGNDFAAVVTGMAANLTFEDLKAIDSGSEFLDEETLIKKLESFRAFHYEATVPRKGSKYRAQLQHDQQVLAALSRTEEFNPAKLEAAPVRDLKKFACREYLARELSYAFFDQPKIGFTEGVLFQMYDKKGKLRLMEAHSLISHKGLHGMMAKLVRPRLNSKPEELQVVFRGTYCKHSFLRDIDPRETMNRRFFDGPGASSFYRWEDKIIKKILLHAQMMDQGKGIEASFSGHSLGGADAMRALAGMVTQLANSIVALPVQKVKLNAFNTPSVEPEVTDKFLKNVSKLKIPIRLRYFDVHHDLLQEVGSKRLGYCGSGVVKPDNLSASVYKFNRNLEQWLRRKNQNILKRTRNFFAKAFEAHTYYCLKWHDTKDISKLNGTFIEDIFTTHRKDVGFTYGKDMDHQSSLIEQDVMDDHLVTELSRIGRKTKRMFHKMLRRFSFLRPDKANTF